LTGGKRSERLIQKSCIISQSLEHFISPHRVRRFVAIRQKSIIRMLLLLLLKVMSRGSRC
jgi:hypothetical protein